MLLELAQSAPHTHHALARNDSAWPELLYWLLEFGDVTTKLRVITRSDNAIGPDLREITQELFGAKVSTAQVQAPQPQVFYVHSVGTNGMAIAALVCSLLCLSFLGIIFGHVAIRQIDKPGEGGRGMALAGLIIG